jgi:hypothetical protein
MSPEQIEQIKAKTRAEWQKYTEARDWFASNPPVWRPVLTPQQKQDQDEYSRKFDLPF